MFLEKFNLLIKSLVNNIYGILDEQNAVLSAGNTKIGDQRIFIDPTGEINSVDTIKNLLVSASGEGKTIYLKDIANVYRGFQSPATKLVRYNSKPAISLGVASVLGANVVKVFDRVDNKVKQTAYFARLYGLTCSFLGMKSFYRVKSLFK